METFALVTMMVVLFWTGLAPVICGAFPIAYELRDWRHKCWEWGFMTLGMVPYTVLFNRMLDFASNLVSQS